MAWSCATMLARGKRGTPEEPLLSCAHSARCAIMPTAMPVSGSDSACLSALKNHSKESLRLLAYVPVESRKRQVLPPPRTPNAKGDHLSPRQGTETVTRMAPRKRERSGWMSAPQISLPHYGCRLSSPYGTPTQATDYGRVSEAAGIYPLRSVTLDRSGRIKVRRTDVMRRGMAVSIDRLRLPDPAL